MPVQDLIDEILAGKEIRLTPRAKQLLALILDALLNEPVHQTVGRPEPDLSHSLKERTETYARKVKQLPELLENIAKNTTNVQPDEDGYQFITVFDVLHNFEKSVGDVPAQFMPGKIP